jgi:GNAT superfamily N-acetyltransferase
MMRLQLTQQDITKTWPIRSLTVDDSPILGPLMYTGYHGTIDDEGETLEGATEEIEATLRGKYGPCLTAASFLIGEPGRPLGASIVSNWTDDRNNGHTQPLLDFMFTHPDARGQGLAIYMLKKTINALIEQGETELVLFVTLGNEAAQHIYLKLGFVVEEEFDTNRVKAE